MGERTGMPRTMARLLGWLLICDPPAQSSAEIASALGMSRASVSIGTRLLEAAGIIRRTTAPGSRAHRFEIQPEAWTSIPAAETYRRWRTTVERGLELVDPGSERAARLRDARDYFGHLEREIPKLIERFVEERTGGS